MWLEKADIEQLKILIRNSPSMYLISKADGSILWANAAFCNWSKYSLGELVKLSWKENLSVNDGDLEADIVALSALNEYNLTYTVQKRYIPKNEKPQLGNLTVMRYPPSGEAQIYFCTWEPLVNGTAQAFELALQAQNKVTTAMAELTGQLKNITNQTDEQRFTLSAITMIAKHPRIAFTIAVAILSIGGFDTILGTLQKLGYVPAPTVKVEESKFDQFYKQYMNSEIPKMQQMLKNPPEQK